MPFGDEGVSACSSLGRKRNQLLTQRPTDSCHAALAARRTLTSRSRHAVHSRCSASFWASVTSIDEAGIVRANDQSTYAAESRTEAPTTCIAERWSYRRACGGEARKLSPLGVVAKRRLTHLQGIAEHPLNDVVFLGCRKPSENSTPRHLSESKARALHSTFPLLLSVVEEGGFEFC